MGVPVPMGSIAAVFTSEYFMIQASRSALAGGPVNALVITISMTAPPASMMPLASVFRRLALFWQPGQSVSARLTSAYFFPLLRASSIDTGPNVFVVEIASPFQFA